MESTNQTLTIVQKLNGKTDVITPNVTPFLLLSPSFIAERNTMWCGIALWAAWVSDSGGVVSQILLQPPGWWGGVRSRKGLEAG